MKKEKHHFDKRQKLSLLSVNTISTNITIQLRQTQQQSNFGFLCHIHKIILG